MVIFHSVFNARAFILTSVGLGPNSGSNIYETVGSTVGAAVADRIFLQNTSTPNFVTVLLGRSDGKLDCRNHYRHLMLYSRFRSQSSLPR